jgi:hypothetical protein
MQLAQEETDEEILEYNLNAMDRNMVWNYKRINLISMSKELTHQYRILVRLV